MPSRLVDRRPELVADDLVSQLVPPPMFAEVSFAGYVPDPDEPSQAAAVRAAEQFVAQVGRGRAARHGLFRRRRRPEPGAGLYLDGGFGVGKTHLLASIYHACPAPKAFGTFVELTHLVGALGFANARARLADYAVLCIDEFELDDPGDTTMIAGLLTELTEHGVSVAATSNTLPSQLGEGRFAAQDFLREIKKLADVFATVRVDGPDYRHRDLPPAPQPLPEAELIARAEATPGATLDDFDALCAHLATLHPSRYKQLVDGVRAVFVDRLHPVADQAVALRLVVLADRLYDASIPVTVSGDRLDRIFPQEMLDGGYRKKYLRATSRLLALSRFAATD
ncbi:cell division protein ZapE [Skermania piniformis]|uniref:Cell division protein ZapE n=1 Tax=Skermania pinensis TaxID=39122 RepID=A0ABX8SF57_9ACTN|nr:cell division protein ZapE [Skermania piniformis]QXQ15230.1 cell division protein ZapE [Skermania piniformis]